MDNNSGGSGSCLCGAVKVSARSVDRSVGACHCGMCRKWGGGPLMAVDCGSDVLFEGEENISIYNSSDWAERGFCRQCGSHLFYRLKENRQHIIPTGIFDAPTSFHFDHQVFIDRKPGYYNFAENTRDLTEAEVFAKYMPGSD